MPIQRRARPEYSRVFAAGFLARDADERDRDAAGRDEPEDDEPERDEFPRDEPLREREDFVPEAMV
jgi:hypothetical protein